MKRLLICVFLLGARAFAAEVVLPQAGFRIVPPEGWLENPAAAGPLVKSTEDPAHTADGMSWTGKGGALFVIWRVSKKPIEGNPLVAVRIALDVFSERRGQVVDSSRAVGDWDATAFITVEPELGKLVIARASVFLDATRALHEIRAECVLSKDEPAARTACEAALSSFALAVADEELSRIKGAAAGDGGAIGPVVPSASAPVKRAEPAASPRPLWAGPGLILVVLLLPFLGFFGYRMLRDLKR